MQIIKRAGVRTIRLSKQEDVWLRRAIEVCSDLRPEVNGDVQEAAGQAMNCLEVILDAGFGPKEKGDS